MYSPLQITCIVLFLTTLVSCKLHCSTDPPVPMLGDLVTLYCKKEINTDNDSFRLVWKSPRTEVITTENFALTRGETAKLLGKITLVEEDNYQLFTCKERRDSQTSNMCEIIPLKIASELIVTATLQPTYETANVTFSCESNMIPKVKRYSWSFDGKPVHDGGRFRISDGGKTLVVWNAMLEDHKKIATCTSFNGLGLNKSGSNIIMIDPNMTPPPAIKSDRDLFMLRIGAGFASMAILVAIFCIVMTILKKRVRKDSEITLDKCVRVPLDDAGDQVDSTAAYHPGDGVYTTLNDVDIQRNVYKELEATTEHRHSSIISDDYVLPDFMTPTHSRGECCTGHDYENEAESALYAHTIIHA